MYGPTELFRRHDDDLNPLERLENGERHHHRTTPQAECPHCTAAEHRADACLRNAGTVTHAIGNVLYACQMMAVDHRYVPTREQREMIREYLNRHVPPETASSLIEYVYRCIREADETALLRSV